MIALMYIMIYGTPERQMEEVFHTMKTITQITTVATKSAYLRPPVIGPIIRILVLTLQLVFQPQMEMLRSVHYLLL